MVPQKHRKCSRENKHDNEVLPGTLNMQLQFCKHMSHKPKKFNNVVNNFEDGSCSNQDQNACM